MSREIVSLARAKYPEQSLTHVVPTSNYLSSKAHPTISGVTVPGHFQNVIRNRITIRQSPVTGTSADLLNGGVLDIKIDRGIIDVIDRAYLKVSITNDTGGSSTLAPSPFFIKTVEILGNNGSQKLALVYDQELWLSLFALTRNEFEQMASLFGTNSTYAVTGTAVADTASRDFYVPLLALLSQAKLVTRGIKGELLLRFTFNVTALTHLSGSLVNVDSVDLLLQGYNEPESITQNRLKVYAGKHMIPMINWWKTTQTLSLAASTTYTIILTGLQGLTNGLFITIRSATITGANQGTYLAQFDRYDIQDASGQSMLGSYQKRVSERLIDYAPLIDNQFASNSNFLLIPFGNPYEAFWSGNNSGFQVFTGYEKFQFTTVAGLASASYIIDFYSLNHSSLMINNGMITSLM